MSSSQPLDDNASANVGNAAAFADVDLEREARQGFPEIIYGAGKTPDQVATIAKQIAKHHGRLLVTRSSVEQFNAVRSSGLPASFEEAARCIYILPELPTHLADAKVSIISAGTSDLPVAMEASLTLRVGGVRAPTLITDVGVSGIHRLLRRSQEFRNADVIIVIAGMEGALPSVVGGLVSAPVIAVPTSVGYGASFEGVAALLGMLNSCASGLTVVNIDNGFGAAMAALRILNTRFKPSQTFDGNK